MARARRSSGRPNDYDWELSRMTSLATPVGTISQTEMFLSDTAETLVRVRGEVVVWLDATGSTIGDMMQFAWGLLRAPSGSSDVGVSPLTEGGANWLAYGLASIGTEVALGNLAAAPGLGAAMRIFHVDSKSMRKLREDESVYFILETADITGAPTVNVGAMFRVLTAR